MIKSCILKKIKNSHLKLLDKKFVCRKIYIFKIYKNSQNFLIKKFLVIKYIFLKIMKIAICS